MMLGVLKYDKTGLWKFASDCLFYISTVYSVKKLVIISPTFRSSCRTEHTQAVGQKF